jgi:hypothetical protein
MLTRKKKGIGLLIGGVGAIGGGLALLLTQSTPEWISLALQVMGVVANVFGFTVVYPDGEEK